MVGCSCLHHQPGSRATQKEVDTGPPWQTHNDLGSFHPTPLPKMFHYFPIVHSWGPNLWHMDFCWILMHTMTVALQSSIKLETLISHLIFISSPSGDEHLLGGWVCLTSLFLNFLISIPSIPATLLQYIGARRKEGWGKHHFVTIKRTHRHGHRSVFCLAHPNWLSVVCGNCLMLAVVWGNFLSSLAPFPPLTTVHFFLTWCSTPAWAFYSSSFTLEYLQDGAWLSTFTVGLDWLPTHLYILLECRV
jgi:hypothetical protein